MSARTLFWLVAVPWVAWGQQHVHLSGVSVSVSSGYEGALAPLEVKGSIAASLGERPLLLALELDVPMAAFDLGDLRAEIGGELELWRSRGWLFRVRESAFLATTSNDAFHARGVGLRVGASAGHGGERWLVALDASASSTVVTWLETTGWARAHGGTPLRSGLLWASAFGLQLGGRAAVLVGPAEVSFRAGWQRRGRFSLVALPLFAVLGVGIRW